LTGYETLSSILKGDSALLALAKGGIVVSFPDDFLTLPVIAYSSSTRDALNSFTGQDKMSNFVVNIWAETEAESIAIETRIEALLFPQFIQGQTSDMMEERLHHKSMKFNILN
jgi:hypothetical protein